MVSLVCQGLRKVPSGVIDANSGQCRTASRTHHTGPDMHVILGGNHNSICNAILSCQLLPVIKSEAIWNAEPVHKASCAGPSRAVLHQANEPFSDQLAMKWAWLCNCYNLHQFRVLNCVPRVRLQQTKGTACATPAKRHTTKHTLPRDPAPTIATVTGRCGCCMDVSCGCDNVTANTSSARAGRTSGVKQGLLQCCHAPF